MRGENTKQSSMLMLMSPETRVPATHPLRAIQKLADAALVKLSPTFDQMYSSLGRPRGIRRHQTRRQPKRIASR